MSTQSHYDAWSTQYDSNENRTRDVEAVAIRKMLEPILFRAVLEIGAGTGKNTVWLMPFANRLVAVDLSAEMLGRAKEKIEAMGNPECICEFMQADVTQPWTFGEGIYDLVSFSLMLEHIAHLEPIFAEAARALTPGGHVYLGELHPLKQYLGTKAKYIADGQEIIVDCYTHHVSDFIQAGAQNGLQLIDLQEFFDDDDRNHPPRILGMLFQKK
jgi:ubiquinone/menaquinone biosynthesis C-methylase UbiE